MEKAEIVKHLVEMKDKLVNSKANAETRADNLESEIEKMTEAIRLIKGE